MDPPDAVHVATAQIKVFAPPGLLVMVDVLRLTDPSRMSPIDAESIPTLDEAIRQLEANYDRRRQAGGTAEAVRVRVTQHELDNLLEKKKPRPRAK